MGHLVADALDPVEHALEEGVLGRLDGARRPFAHAASLARGVAAEELGLGDDRLLELVDQDALVRRVDVGEAVGGAEQQDLGVGRRLAAAR